MSRKKHTHRSVDFLTNILASNRSQHRRRQRKQTVVVDFNKSPGLIGELLEERTLLAGVNDDPANPAWQVDVRAVAKDDVLALLQAVETVAVAQAGGDAVDRSLQGLDKSLNQLLTDANGDVVSTKALSLHTGIANYLNGFTYTGADFPTVHGLAVAIDSAVQPFGGAVDVDLDAINLSSQLDLQIVVAQTVNSELNLSIETPQSAMEQDLEITGTASVDVAAHFAAYLSLNAIPFNVFLNRDSC